MRATIPAGCDNWSFSARPVDWATLKKILISSCRSSDDVSWCIPFPLHPHDRSSRAVIDIEAPSPQIVWCRKCDVRMEQATDFRPKPTEGAIMFGCEKGHMKCLKYFSFDVGGRGAV